MARCKFCKMDSVDLVWCNIEHNVNLPPKWALFEGEIRHNCRKKILPTMTLCPQCNPETRKPIEASKLQDHIKLEHFGFW